MNMKEEKSLGRFPGVHTPRARWGIVAIAGLSLVLLALLYFMRSGSATLPFKRTSTTRPPAPRARTVPAPPVEIPALLEIGADEWTWERSDDFVVVSGHVRNISDKTLANVVAEVSFYDQDGRFIVSAEAFIAPNLIHAGQTVAFEIRKPWDPAFKEARVGFQEIMGYPIETRWKQTE